MILLSVLFLVPSPFESFQGVRVGEDGRPRPFSLCFLVTGMRETARILLAHTSRHIMHAISKNLCSFSFAVLSAFSLWCTCCWCSTSGSPIQFGAGFEHRIPCLPCLLVQILLDKVFKPLMCIRLALECCVLFAHLHDELQLTRLVKLHPVQIVQYRVDWLHAWTI